MQAKSIAPSSRKIMLSFIQYSPSKRTHERLFKRTWLSILPRVVYGSSEIHGHRHVQFVHLIRCGGLQNSEKTTDTSVVKS